MCLSHREKLIGLDGSAQNKSDPVSHASGLPNRSDEGLKLKEGDEGLAHKQVQHKGDQILDLTEAIKRELE